MCIYRAVFGIPCPGCGMTRAFEHLVHGDVVGAFYFHPLFWVAILFLFAIIFRRIAISQFLLSLKGFYWTMSLFAVVYVVRMFMYFPSTTPLAFNKHAILANLFS
ncbi:DUF2752 domain-containing protein [Periweissella cryptocerci]|uniref:DUF2752 domain-containing protein n=1 Tax=Periweissella cryptocerci TaxID=2506420 RepID=A0A4P6YTD7_9LACO|nr:DUF2752 domain-containing protein [Periweissella cryptocerci]